MMFFVILRMPRISTTKKHKAVYAYFINLFEVKRRRYDDCIELTADHFFYSKRTVENILRSFM
jgi:hypothetical protein